jgi:hypothetical protein
MPPSGELRSTARDRFMKNFFFHVPGESFSSSEMTLALVAHLAAAGARATPPPWGLADKADGGMGLASRGLFAEELFDLDHWMVAFKVMGVTHKPLRDVQGDVARQHAREIQQGGHRYGVLPVRQAACRTSVATHRHKIFPRIKRIEICTF